MPGSILILMGCIVLDGINYNSLRVILIIILILITNPVATNAIGRLDNNSLKSYNITRIKFYDPENE